MSAISDDQAKKNLSGSGNLRLIAIMKGLMISYIITIPIFLIFAFILSNTDYPEKFISPVVLLTTVISILLAGSTATRGAKSKGWLNGCIVGAIYIFILYLVSSVIFNDFSVNRYTVTMFVIAVLSGAIGGIIGINLKQSRRYK